MWRNKRFFGHFPLVSLSTGLLSRLFNRFFNHPALTWSRSRFTTRLLQSLVGEDCLTDHFAEQGLHPPRTADCVDLRQDRFRGGRRGGWLVPFPSEQSGDSPQWIPRLLPKAASVRVSHRTRGVSPRGVVTYAPSEYPPAERGPQ